MTLPLPDDLEPITTLTGVITKFAGGVAGSGTVTFRTEGWTIAGEPPALIYGAEETVTIAADGSFSVTWVPGDDPDGEPSTVTVSFALDNGTVVPPRTVIVPADAAGPVNVFGLPTVTPIDPGTSDPFALTQDAGDARYVRLSRLGAAAQYTQGPSGTPVLDAGAATLDEQGRVPVGQIVDLGVFPPEGHALGYSQDAGGVAPLRVDDRFRGYVGSTPTDAGEVDDWFRHSGATAESPMGYVCTTAGDAGTAVWVAFGAGGTGGGGTAGVAAVAVNAPLTLGGSASTPVIGLPLATTSTPGAMSAQDKQAVMAAAPASSVVPLVGPATKSGVLTFTTAPVVPDGVIAANPATVGQLATKAALLHGASHNPTTGTDPLPLAIEDVTGLGSQLTGKAPADERTWNPVSRTWSTRPTVPAGVVVKSLSTADVTATPPPGAVVGDMWITHPDAV